ncbi:MAG: amidohydrolase [Alphaproteobacteria bacterium]|nr:amidohydrolase [Alphaproteobacteria bacterium]
MRFLSQDEIDRLSPAETAAFPGPIPTQIVSSDEYLPTPQTPRQREVEARLKDLGGRLAKHQGLSRRAFFRTAAGMASAFIAMNEVWGPIFQVSRAEAAMPDLAAQRAQALKGQFIMDTHTHFLRDDTRLTGFIAAREAVGRSGWNPQLQGRPQTLEDLKFGNYFKEIYLDSDTKVALISGSPSEIAEDWFLTNEQAAEARDKVNREAGTKRLLAHAMFTPGYPNWLDNLDRALALKPDSMKGYTVGDNTHKESSHYPWRMDDEKLAYLAYEKFVKAGIKNVCVHKGLFSPATEQRFPNLRPYADVRDVGKAAKDWPELNFIIYHGGYRHVGGSPEVAMAEFDSTGRSSWVSDLADIPAQYGVTNVYADLGQLFAHSTVSQPRLCAALMGILVKGMGADHVIWGTDAVWTGSPQWQIEGLRRLEIPEDMQKKHGFSPLGLADGPIKTAIFGENVARLYGHRRTAGLDRFDSLKAQYEERGPMPSNRRYGFVAAG